MIPPFKARLLAKCGCQRFLATRCEFNYEHYRHLHLYLKNSTYVIQRHRTEILSTRRALLCTVIQYLYEALHLKIAWLVFKVKLQNLLDGVMPVQVDIMDACVTPLRNQASTEITAVPQYSVGQLWQAAQLYEQSETNTQTISLELRLFGRVAANSFSCSLLNHTPRRLDQCIFQTFIAATY